MIRPQFAPFRGLFLADFGGPGTARVKTASAGWIQRAWYVSLQPQPGAISQMRGQGLRFCRHQGNGIGVERPVDDIIGQANFHELAQIGHRDPI